MKVKVISSRHSHINANMEGEAHHLTLIAFVAMTQHQEIAVEFKNVRSPVPGENSYRNTTVMMHRCELQACN